MQSRAGSLSCNLESPVTGWTLARWLNQSRASWLSRPAANAVAGGGSEAVVRGELIWKDPGQHEGEDRDAQRPTFVSLRRRLLTCKRDWLPYAILMMFLCMREGGAQVFGFGETSRLALVSSESVWFIGLSPHLVNYRGRLMQTLFQPPDRTRLHERKQKELLGMWREGIEDADPVARALYEQNRRGADEFLQDHPEFSKLVRLPVYWHHFVLVACIFGRFGLTNQDGSRAVYSFCGHIRHSCSPNAAWFTLHKGFPRGKKMLHTINLEGIARGEEITVSYVDESVLILPKVQRSVRMFATASMSCTCRKCGDSNEEEDERIRYLFGKLMASLAVKPPSDDSAATALRSLNELDKLLPFSMQAKAKAKVLLASILGELSQRAAWQEENKSANIIQWTGLDAESQEQRLKDTKQLYETAAKDFEYLLGQATAVVISRMLRSTAFFYLRVGVFVCSIRNNIFGALSGTCVSAKCLCFSFDLIALMRFFPLSFDIDVRKKLPHARSYKCSCLARYSMTVSLL
ncbi:unnamed protein product [Polarella glacialis]|uniref:SET domain-containing protein n=1 Tax=Polarella glacialis TaxID=89957 RepID=A0A813HL80_POLGL|nr:unnamed protein product [Polarella glacialis]